MHKTKKILIILIILVVILIAVLIARSAIETHKKDTFVYTSIDQFETPEDVIKYLGSEYIAQEESVAEEFSLDIYLKIKEELYTNGASNEEYYDNLMDMVAYVLDYESFRLVDDEKQILIAVVCNSENRRITRKYINGDYNYFGNEKSKNNFEQFKEIETTNFEIQSEELINLINNNWKSSNMDFGEVTRTLGKYTIYENETIQVRNVYKKVFNIVFRYGYEKPIINGITPETSKEDIIKILGQPTITSEYEDVFGYKGEHIYVFFTYGDISIYRVEQYESEEFAKLVEEFINDADVKTFVSSVTDIWPDYDQYDYDADYVNLVYTLKGIKIQFNVTSNHGVVVYNNYEGEILQGITLENINADDVKNNIFFENENTMIENEITRANYYEVETPRRNLNIEKNVLQML